MIHPVYMLCINIKRIKRRQARYCLF